MSPRKYWLGTAALAALQGGPGRVLQSAEILGPLLGFEPDPLTLPLGLELDPLGPPLGSELDLLGLPLGLELKPLGPVPVE